MNDGIAWIELDTRKFGFLGFPGLSILSRGNLFISPDEQLDMLEELKRQSCVCFVTLLEEQELPEGEFASLTEAISQAGLEHLHFPIVDFSVPSSSRLQPIMVRALRHLERGETIAFCCLAGLGRSGFMAAMLLMHLGYTAEAAINRIRSEQPDAIESDEQIAVIKAYSVPTA